MSEFTHFNSVIHLSKVKQLAIFRFSPIGRGSVEQLAAVWLQFFQMTCLTAATTFFFQYCSSIFSCRQLQHEDSRHRPCLQVWWLFLFGRWWSSIVHVIHLNTDSRLWGWRQIWPLSLQQGEICTIMWMYHFINLSPMGPLFHVFSSL